MCGALCRRLMVQMRRSKRQGGATQDGRMARPMLTGLETDGATT